MWGSPALGGVPGLALTSRVPWGTPPPSPSFRFQCGKLFIGHFDQGLLHLVRERDSSREVLFHADSWASARTFAKQHR